MNPAVKAFVYAPPEQRGGVVIASGLTIRRKFVVAFDARIDVGLTQIAGSNVVSAPLLQHRAQSASAVSLALKRETVTIAESPLQGYRK